MLSDRVVNILARKLIALDHHLNHHLPHDTDQSGTLQLGTLVLAQDFAIGEVTDRCRGLHFIHLHLRHHPQHARAVPAGLQQIADHLTSPAATGTPPADLPADPGELAALQQYLTAPLPDRRNLAWAVCYTDITAGHDTAGVDTVGAVYRIDVVDRDGRVYQYEHTAGEQPSLVIYDHPALSHLPGEQGLPATHPALHMLAVHLPDHSGTPSRPAGNSETA